jgi:transcriptional antiterminator RfaH
MGLHDIDGKVSTLARWYLVQLKPNGLTRAVTNIERQGFCPFVPRERRSVRRSGKFVTVDAPVFPGYIFVQLNREDRGWRVINSTYGVARIVSFGGLPAPLPKGLVEEMAARYANTGDAPPPFAIGDDVILREGPFVDFLAKVEAVDPLHRVHLLIDFMGRQSRIVVQAEKLSKL